MHESLAGQNKPLGSGPAAGGVGDSRGIAEVMAHRLGTAEGQQRDSRGMAGRLGPAEVMARRGAEVMARVGTLVKLRPQEVSSSL